MWMNLAKTDVINVKFVFFLSPWCIDTLTAEGAWTISQGPVLPCSLSMAFPFARRDPVWEMLLHASLRMRTIPKRPFELALITFLTPI